MNSEPQNNPTVSEPGQATPRVGIAGRIMRLGFGLIFQLATSVALFFAVHLVRGKYEDSVYKSSQRVIGGVLGFPAAAFGLGVLLAAIYTAATGKRGALTFKLAGAAVALFVVMYALELALK
jgi:hypothetical protein